jgi:hypothetical protein
MTIYLPTHSAKQRTVQHKGAAHVINTIGVCNQSPAIPAQPITLYVAGARYARHARAFTSIAARWTSMQNRIVSRDCDFCAPSCDCAPRPHGSLRLLARRGFSEPVAL